MTFRLPAASLTAIALVAFASVSLADHHAPTPAEGPVLPPPPVAETSMPAAASSMVVEASPAVVCCPIEVVKEKVTRSARKAYRCHGAGKPQVLCVDNPADCTCKLYSVPVCLPACCVGEPACCGTKVGLLGRGYVTYRWPCGFEATIVFRVHGGAQIVYR